MHVEKTEVLVIGAGPAGSVAAAYLNNQGHQVKVIEKAQFPRFVIGESLLPVCLDAFEKAGLIEAIKEQNYQKKIGATFIRSKEEFCQFNFAEQYTDGYPHAWQMARADLDKTLIDEAQRQGVEVNFGESVEAIEFSSEKALVTINDEKNEAYQIEADFVVDASGFGRVLPRLLDLNKPSNFPGRTAFFAHVQTKGAENEEVLTEILDFGDTNWAWVIPFREGVVSIGFVGDQSFFDRFDESNDQEKFKAILQKHHRLKDNFTDNFDFIFEPRLMKGFSIGVKQMYGDRFVLVGNSTEFLDPIFSSGVAFAAVSGWKAGEVLHKHLNGQEVDWQKDYSEYMQYGIDVFRSYVEKWYNGTLQTVFFATGKTPLVKRQICSVLAGYVWDKTNPYVRKHSKATDALAKVIKIQKAAKAQQIIK